MNDDYSDSGCSQQAGDSLSCVSMDNSKRQRLGGNDTNGLYSEHASDIKVKSLSVVAGQEY